MGYDFFTFFYCGAHDLVIHVSRRSATDLVLSSKPLPTSSSLRGLFYTRWLLAGLGFMIHRNRAGLRDAQHPAAYWTWMREEFDVLGEALDIFG